MDLVDTLKDALTRPTSDGKRADQPIESYWCYDCGERLLAEEVESEEPTCPSCGEPMEFDRSVGTASCPG